MSSLLNQYPVDTDLKKLFKNNKQPVQYPKFNDITPAYFRFAFESTEKYNKKSASSKIYPRLQIYLSCVSKDTQNGLKGGLNCLSLEFENVNQTQLDISKTTHYSCVNRTHRFIIHIQYCESKLTKKLQNHFAIKLLLIIK